MAVLGGFLTVNNCGAQNLTIGEVTKIENDLSARVNMMETKLGTPCALIKLKTNLEDLQFSSYSGITEVQFKMDGYWIYLDPNHQSMSIYHESFGEKNIDFPIKLESMNTYSLTVFSASLSTYELTFHFNEPDVNIQGAGENKQSNKYGFSKEVLPEGDYTFTFSKSGFRTRIVNVSLREDLVMYVHLFPEISNAKSGIKKVKGFLLELNEVTERDNGSKAIIKSQKIENSNTFTLVLEDSSNIELKGPGSIMGCSITKVDIPNHKFTCVTKDNAVLLYELDDLEEIVELRYEMNGVETISKFTNRGKNPWNALNKNDDRFWFFEKDNAEILTMYLSAAQICNKSNPNSEKTCETITLNSHIALYKNEKRIELSFSDEEIYEFFWSNYEYKQNKDGAISCVVDLESDDGLITMFLTKNSMNFMIHFVSTTGKQEEFKFNVYDFNISDAR